MQNKIKKGYDIADAHQDGVDLVAFVRDCPRLIDEDFPTTPYDAFCHAIKYLYGKENFEQFDGLFYLYKSDEHYWEERLEKNFKSDLQKWIELNMIKYLSETDSAIHTFAKNTLSFLNNYSASYYKGNPFKNSAIQPYLHVKNGAIEITDTGFNFLHREEKGEDFFRKLYPLHALDFDFDLKYYKDENLKDLAPTFHYYLESIVPEPEYKTPETIKEHEAELELTKEFFSQVIAYTLNPIKHRPHFFAMYGGQDTGKSFFLKFLRTIVGTQFFVRRKIEVMTKNNKFAEYDLWGAKVYYDDDVRANVALPDDFVKSCSGLEETSVEPKFEKTIKNVKISVAMYFISNHAFTVAGGTQGIERRFIFIPYKKTIKAPDVFLLDKIIGKKPKGTESGTHAGEQFDERPAIIGFALRGIESLIRNNHNFVMPNWIAEERKDWLIRSNTITQFLYEQIFPATETSYPSKELYDKYKDWCKDEESRKPYGKNKFYEMLKLEPRVTHKHYSTGDYFKFELDNKTELDEELRDIPF
jgi:phage/plasmid-associated DNA primase